MIVYVNKTETASATHDVELDHACSACNKVSPAWVRGKATVTESRGAFSPGSSDAQFLAETEAQRNAAMLIRIARCPHCQTRDPVEMRKVWMRLVWAFVGIEACHAVWAALGYRDYFVDWMGLASTSLGVQLVGLGAVGIKIWRDLQASDTRVRFIKEQKSEEQGPYRSAV
jgi:hypothetical protein